MLRMIIVITIYIFIWLLCSIVWLLLYINNQKLSDSTLYSPWNCTTLSYLYQTIYNILRIFMPYIYGLNILNILRIFMP